MKRKSRFEIILNAENHKPLYNAKSCSVYNASCLAVLLSRCHLISYSVFIYCTICCGLFTVTIIVKRARKHLHALQVLRNSRLPLADLIQQRSSGYLLQKCTISTRKIIFCAFLKAWICQNFQKLWVIYLFIYFFE